MSLTVLERPVFGDEPVPVPDSRDRTAWWLALVAALISVGSYVYFELKGLVLAYPDSISHMEIARRVVDSPTTGMSQLGGVWLPMPHILMLPFIWNNWMYYHGLAGSIVSMASYVSASVLIFKILLDLTGKRSAGLVGALIFMSNPNILYMQSTPMTELLEFACMLGMIYFTQRWIKTERTRYLTYTAIAAFMGTLTRYETWILLAVLSLVMIYVVWRKRYQWSLAEDVLLHYMGLGGAGIAAWLGWNELIFGNPFYFQFGPYSKSSLWVSTHSKAVNHWVVSLKTYSIATVDDLLWPIVALAIIGLIVYVARERLKPESLPVLSTLAMFPFFVIAVEKGLRPLHVMQIEGNLYNVRFGLLMVLPAALLIGYLASLSNRSRIRHSLALIVCVPLAIYASMTIVNTNHIPTLEDPVQSLHDPQSLLTNQASVYMREHYRGGRILMQSFGNARLLFDAHISLGVNIYEGSNHLWHPALKQPGRFNVTWIIMHYTDGGDEVYKRLHASAALDAYKLVYRNGAYDIYERIP